MTDTAPEPPVSPPAFTAATGAPTPDASTTGPSPPPPGKLQAHAISLPVAQKARTELTFGGMSLREQVSRVEAFGKLQSSWIFHEDD
jgi:hypothetical protein